MSRNTDRKKTRSRSKANTKTLGEGTGFTKILDFTRSEKVHFFLGIILLAISVCMAWSFVSFFTTGAFDQSIIENLRSGDMENQNELFKNAIGSIGAWTSYYFMNRCFGVAAFGIPLFLVLLSLALMRAYRVSLLKWFFCIALLTIWSSVALAMFVNPLVAESHFCLGGEHGLYIGDFVTRYVGLPGLVAILGLVALCFLGYVSNETIIWIRKLLNPTRFLQKVKFTVTNNAKEEDGEETSSYENLIQTEEDPEVFDDPKAEEIVFEHQGPTPNEKPVVNDDTDDEEPVGNTKDKDDIDMDIVVAGDGGKADGKNVSEAA
jgi:S-DNA-T family DNA segregation ATPase FtsK/SpoIIIE